MDKTAVNFSVFLRQQTAENSAFRVLLGALFASHPAPEKLRTQIANYCALEMTALASLPNANDQFRQDVKTHFSTLIEAMLAQVPPSVDGK